MVEGSGAYTNFLLDLIQNWQTLLDNVQKRSIAASYEKDKLELVNAIQHIAQVLLNKKFGVCDRKNSNNQ